jgi:hypothetical protein
MMGSGTGCSSAFFTAIITVATGCRGALVTSSVVPSFCSCATASSSTTVALVSSTSECTETSVNSVTNPSGPYIRPISAMPIMTVLEKVLASASTAARRLKPCTSRVPPKHDDHRQEVGQHRFEVELFDAHPAHGAEQQRRREQQEDQV